MGKGNPPQERVGHCAVRAKTERVSLSISRSEGSFPYSWTWRTQAFLTWDSKAYEQLLTSQGFIFGTGVRKLGLSPSSSQIPRVSNDRHYRQSDLR